MTSGQEAAQTLPLSGARRNHSRKACNFLRRGVPASPSAASGSGSGRVYFWRSSIESCASTNDRSAPEKEKLLGFLGLMPRFFFLDPVVGGQKEERKKKKNTGPASSAPARRFLSAKLTQSIVIFVCGGVHETRCLF